MPMRASGAEVAVHEATALFNNQPDALTAIIKHRTEIKGHLGDLFIQQFSKEGDYVQICLRPPPKRREIEVKIPIEPALDTGHDVRPLLMAWRKQAYAHFKVPEVPVVDYFKMPSAMPFMAPAGIALCFLFFSLWGTGYYADLVRAKVADNLGKHFLKGSAWFAGALHLVIEPAYMLYMTQKHGTPMGARWKWILGNIVFGYAFVDEFWECIIYERLRHVYKQTDVGDIGANTEAGTVSAQKKKQ